MDAVPTPPADRRWHMIDERDLMPLINEHNAWRRLCDRLEAVADRLPLYPSTVEAAALRCEIRTAIPPDGAQELRLAGIAGHTGLSAEAAECLARIVERRMALTVLAQDVAEALAEAPSADRAGAFAYALRNLFTNCRDLVTIELFALLAIADRRLMPSGRALISHRLAQLSKL